MEKKYESGVITVYLALTLSIILSFIVTTIECARINTVKTYLNRVLQTSMESSLCDYYLPMFENYHLFGYDLQQGSLEDHKQKLVMQVMNRMNDSLEPEKNANLLTYFWNGTPGSFLLCNPKLNRLDISDCTYLCNENGDYARKQMTAYMKYQAPMELLEMLLEALEVLEDGDTTTKIINEKLEVEKKMLNIDTNALKLVELIEGIETNDYGIDFTCFFGGIKCSDYFVKQIVTEPPTMSNVRISNYEIFSQLEDDYMQFPKVLDLLVVKAEYLINQAKEFESIDLNNYTEDEWMEYQKQIEEYEQECYMTRTIAQCLMDTVTNIDSCIDEALDIIHEIENGQENLGLAYQNYLMNANELKEGLSGDIFNELNTDSEDIERYTESENVSVIKDIHKMKETLLENQQLLKDILATPAVPFSLEEEEFQKWLAVMNEWSRKLYGLKNDGLEFDYKGINLRPQQGGAFTFIRKLIGSGFVDLVASDLDISEEELTRVELPSYGSELSENFYVDKENFTMGRVLNGGLSFEGQGLVVDGESGTEAFIDDLLLNAYVAEHMSDFTSEEYKVGQVIKYEQEYVICGDYADDDNFGYAVMQLILIRFLMNLISVLSDSSKSKKAEATAVAVAGWIPVAGVTTVVKYLILAYWAYCEAVVEVSALVHGKSVPIYTTKADFKVKYEDILSLNKSYVKKQATSYECSSKLKLTYSQYLFILMLMVSDENITLRSLDLIQENLRYEYDSNFRIHNCLVSYSCKAEGYMKQKFLMLPFFQQNNISIDGYVVRGQSAVTY